MKIRIIKENKINEQEDHVHPKGSDKAGFAVNLSFEGGAVGVAHPFFHNGSDRKGEKGDATTAFIKIVSSAPGGIGLIPLLLDARGKVIGFQGKGGQNHFHAPGNGWGELEKYVKRGFTVDKNKFVNQRLYELPPPS